MQRKQSPRVMLLWLLVLLSAGGALGGCVSHAKTDGEEKVTYTLTKKAFMHLQRVQEHASKKEWKEALEELDSMAERKFLNPYERAMMWNARAGIYAATNKFDMAMKSLEEALKLESMPDEQQLDTQYNLAQLYLVNERFEDSGNLFAKWLEKAKNPDPSTYFLTASAYSQAKKFDKALPYAKKAVEQMKKPEESWMGLLLSIHYELKDNESVAAMLKKLLKLFPKKEYWLQLSATYSAMDDTAKALAVLEVALAKDLLTEEKEFVVLAQLYNQEGVPLKAASLMEAKRADGTVTDSPENLELLATSWLMANDREKAEATLKEAAGAASSSALYLRLAQFHIERHKWSKALEAITEAQQLGDLEDPGEALVLTGIVHYNMKHYDAALRSLEKAKEHEKSKADAQQWIDVIRSERGAPSSGDSQEAADGEVAAGGEK
ncbi:MAG: hypothetical protein OEZ06_03860 [Myxococcales bacterium]|nr:hypothetical protein [Myxococcales bacterium]